LKISPVIDKLKGRLSANLTGKKPINNTNGSEIFTLANDSNQEEAVCVFSTSNQASYQKCASGSTACENVSVARQYRVK
jgi:hypothetical protein